MRGAMAEPIPFPSPGQAQIVCAQKPALLLPYGRPFCNHPLRRVLRRGEESAMMELHTLRSVAAAQGAG